MKKYQWANQQLKKKAQQYNMFMLIFMALALLCVLLLPEAFRVYNFIALGIAMILWILSWRTQVADNRLKKPRKIEHIDKS